MSYILWQYWIDETDDRIKHYPLFGGPPDKLMAIMLLWLLFVTKLGPKLMRNREPFVLRKPIMVYNFILVVINVYFVYKSVHWLEFGSKSLDPKLSAKYQWTDADIANVPDKMFYSYTKIFDLLDTVFFVLRKKFNQISFLHVYHHFMVPVMSYVVVKLGPQSVGIEVFCFLNSIVHTIMYSYYLLSAFGPWIQPYLWWKRYITRLQLIQFVLLIVYAIYCFLYGDTSGVSDGLKVVFYVQPFVFFYMFARFYIQSYSHKTCLNMFVGIHICHYISEHLLKSIFKLNQS
ncbi:unnamed protein product, partial [Medioppia subpectinata]